MRATKRHPLAPALVSNTANSRTSLIARRTVTRLVHGDALALVFGKRALGAARVADARDLDRSHKVLCGDFVCKIDAFNASKKLAFRVRKTILG